MFLVNGATGTLDYYIVDYIISLWIIIHHCGLLLSLWIIIIIVDYYYCGLLLQPLQGMDEYRRLIQKKEDVVRLEWCSPGGQQIVCVSDLCMFQRIR